MASSLGDVIIQLRSQDVNMTSGLKSVEEGVGKLTDKVFSFEGALHIAFGAAASRKIFHMIHESVMELGEGFSEAQARGEGFYDSLNEGINKVKGLKSSYEEATEAAKKLTEANAVVAKAFAQVNKDTGNQQPGMYPFLKEGEKDEQAIKDVQNKRDEAQGELTKAIQKKKDDEKKEEERLRALGPTMGAIVRNDPDQKALREANDRDNQSAIDAARAKVNKLSTDVSVLQNQLAVSNIEEGAGKAQAAVQGMWSNLTDTVKDLWTPVAGLIGKTGEGFAKGVKKENEKLDAERAKNIDAKMRLEAKELEEHNKIVAEQQKKDANEAKHFLESADPMAKLKDDLSDVDRLTKSGNLSSAQSQQVKQHLAEEAARKGLGHAEFRSADSFANDLLAKSVDAAALQKRANDLLDQIQQNTSKPNGVLV